ncbi:Na(+)/H(+) antiporter subunit B [Pseudoalteromonas sp. OOF1S-7]|uniref:Na(+)/H(+) antiporter subunit B n=1 Tax=Pseudoalteromonas sp. OOF1S-7 TaxID=2917757 RepID=UPI001EF44991|nr:Na(+)/H(+) antiporter subunit B [Pseudoalteromonas sp. OOF1S-7]MCG7535093.1 Na(+)/H(+) antiporter subunit B [Pseudoalteromonas sp. OOF1S-7]
MFNNLTLGRSAQHKADLPVGVLFMVALAIAAACLFLTMALIDFGPAEQPLVTLVASHLEQSGVENPVTAVLLNFRSYDTLLEVAVLLIVALAVMPANSEQSKVRFISVLVPTERSFVLEAFLRWLLPAIVVTSGYLLWTGAALPGGAFQAGALLAGAGILLLLAGHHSFNFNASAARLLLVVGLAVFLLVGAAVILSSGIALAYPQAWAGILILVIEVAATLTIAAILVLLFCALQVEAPRANYEGLIKEERP